nr:hypothetical protein [Tanacetum cinerariifolium]
DVIENESHLISEIVNNNLGSMAMLTKHYELEKEKDCLVLVAEVEDFWEKMVVVVVVKCLLLVVEGLLVYRKELRERGEVMDGGVDFRVSRSLLCEILREIMGDKFGEEFRVDGGVIW